MKILHLSDLHFHRDNKDNAKIIKTLKNVKEKYPEHYIVVTGDIVDDGHELQYENAFENLKIFRHTAFSVLEYMINYSLWGKGRRGRVDSNPPNIYNMFIFLKIYPLNH